MVSRNKVVSMKYTLRDPQGKELDASGDEPLEFLAGHQNIIPGLERELEGMNVGDRKNVKVKAAEAYGELNEDLRFEVPLSSFGGQKPPEGAMVEMRSEDGHRIVARVTGIHGEHVHLDANHPLAGVDLDFDVEISGMRDATADEISHGHAHGPHGHHHH